MERYDRDDQVTIYFVIHDLGDRQQVQAWSDNKEYVKAYMEFHKCRNFKLKSMTDVMRNILPILDENTNDEISLYNLTVKNPNHKRGKEAKYLVAPLTSTESMMINDEAKNFLLTRINYGYANEAFPYLKNKYQKALKDIFFEIIMKHIVYNTRNKLIEEFMLDELMILYESFPEHFGD